MSSAQREANLVFAKSAVRTDKIAVKSAETALQHTKLLAPQEGTVITLSGTVGETVTATGTSKVSTATTSSSSTSGSTSGQGAGSSSGASTSSSSASSAFAVISNLRSMQVVVPLSEAEIANVHTGQPATVTIEALDKKLAAQVVSVAATSTSSSGVVTYDVTFHLDQLVAGLKAGMSAGAEVVIKQAEGLNVLTSAISNGSVTVVRDGKDVSQSVTTGLAGNTSTIILSGLTAGETVLLPSTKTTSTGSSASSTRGSSSSGSLGSSALGGSGGGSEGPPGGGPPGGGGAP